MSSLDILKSRFGATRGLFWAGPRRFEPRSDEEDGTSPVTPSPNFRTMPTGRRLTPTYELRCSRPQTRRIFSGIGSQNLDLFTRPPRP
ncbi:hypothetical protein AVEN_21459-1 [Araneus ventricosus]|uniref:Uncharacterized protein n=1 Tax=Araneus ventricosus TaxID=182803 RepID=A0A4Y2GGG3_ARAVE|nr:hypothetical protein AVEN_21459-1 [Araneus ventricosus]